MTNERIHKPQAPYPWQQAIWQRLVTQWHQAALPHGILFVAPYGLGYIELALSWAAFLFCEAPTARPCQQCRNCLAVHENRHANLFFVDGATTGVQEVRGLHGELFLSTKDTRLVVVHHAEALSTAAVNAWLKCLEDPPEQTIFLMLCNHAAALPATLRSRLVCYQAPRATPDQALQFLQPQLASNTVSQADVDAMLACCGGPLAVWDALEQGMAEQLHALEHLLSGVGAGRLSALEAAAQRPTALALEQALRWLIWHVTQHLKAYDTNKGVLASMAPHEDKRPPWLKTGSLDTWLMRYDAFVALCKRLKENQLGERLGWETFFLLIADDHAAG